MEDDRIAVIEAQLAQAKQIADEADRKYEEVKSTENKFVGDLRFPRIGTPNFATHTNTMRCENILKGWTIYFILKATF